MAFENKIAVSSEDPVAERCEIIIYDPRQTPWKKIREDILRIEQTQFGRNAFDEQTFIDQFADPETVVVLIRDRETNHAVGFTYADPAEKAYGISFHPERKLRTPEELNQTAYIEDTAIDPDYTGHHLVGPLIDALKKELWKRNFRYIERDAAVANNYAANIAKNEKENILYQEPHDSQWGPQIFFRIKLTE